MRVPPRPFPPALGARFRAALAESHARQPFAPAAVRDAARRVAAVADRFSLDATTYRGGLDVGGAELDHVWVVVEERVVDVVLPLFADGFVENLRAYVVGEIDDTELDRAAHPYSVSWRVIGEYPETYRYTGAPVWGEASTILSDQ